MGRLSDDLDRRDLHLAARDSARLFAVELEEILGLQGANRLIARDLGQMVILRPVAILHAAIGNSALEFGIAFQRCDEPRDMLAPDLRRAILEMIFDEKLLHFALPFDPALRLSLNWRLKERSRKYGQN